MHDKLFSLYISYRSCVYVWPIDIVMAVVDIKESPMHNTVTP